MEMVYLNNKLKYPLQKDEYKGIEKCWDFINEINKPFIFLTDYRNNIINKLSQKYTANEFMFYESIIEKLFWNLRWLLYPFFVSENNDLEIPNDLIKCEIINYENPQDLKKIINENIKNKKNYYRSFINKLIIVDPENKLVYCKEMEGSSNIFSRNLFNELTLEILMDRELYEKIMQNPQLIKKIKPEQNYFYQKDYAFPNLNLCSYKIGSENDRLDRISKMYYTGDSRYWFKIILNNKNF